MADPKSSLQRLPSTKVKPDRDIWLLTHRVLRQTARGRVFIEFMAEAIRGHTELLEGRVV